MQPTDSQRSDSKSAIVVTSVPVPAVFSTKTDLCSASVVGMMWLLEKPQKHLINHTIIQIIQSRI